MAALYSFLDGAIADIRSKLDLEYQKRLAAHEKTISEELSPEDYTPDYGKINVVDALSHFYNEGHRGRPPAPCNPQITKWVGVTPHLTQTTIPVTDTHPKGRWFIHYIPVTTSSYHQEINYNTYNWVQRSTYHMYLIDNYGLIYTAGCDHTTTDKTQVKLWRLDVDSVLSASTASYKYKLPNFLIDFCKKQKQGSFTGDSLQLLAEQYYKRFTVMKPLFTEGRFTDYESLLATKNSLEEQLATATTSLKAAKQQITTISAKSEHTMTDMLLEIEQLKATMATEAKKAADLALEVYRQLEAVRAERDTLQKELTDLRTRVSSLASETGIADDSAIESIRERYMEMRESLAETKAELVTAKAEIDRYHSSEENYVSQLFQQRQDITAYKKQLLSLNAVEPAPAPLNIEELVAQAVRKALEKPAPMPSLEVTDL